MCIEYALADGKRNVVVLFLRRGWRGVQHSEKAGSVASSKARSEVEPHLERDTHVTKTSLGGYKPLRKTSGVAFQVGS